MAASGKFALRDYLLTTSERLNVEGFSPSKEELQKKIMPTVTNNVKTKSGGAPQTVRDGLKAAFFDRAVLPSFEADLDTFREAMEACLDVLREAGIEGIPEKKAAAADVDAGDVFAMMGGMGAEEGYKTTLLQEEAAEEEAVEGDADDVFAMMGGMGAESCYKVTQVEEEAEKKEEAETPAKKGRMELIEMIDGFLDKLDSNPPNAQILKTRAMPKIVGDIKNKSAGAPQELRLKLKGIFEENNVLPSYEADIDYLKQALIQIQAAVRSA